MRVHWLKLKLGLLLAAKTVFGIVFIVVLVALMAISSVGIFQAIYNEVTHGSE